MIDWTKPIRCRRGYAVEYFGERGTRAYRRQGHILVHGASLYATWTENGDYDLIGGQNDYDIENIPEDAK